MGVTIIDYLTDVRIGHAKLLLLSTDKSCSIICFEVGYNNQSYFTRTFKEMVGMTPRQFRESNRRDNGAKASRRRIQFAANSPDSPSPIHAAK
jgi:AraC-like DNA-binding protein